MAKVDAHEITPEEYEEIPELTEDFFRAARPTNEVLAEIAKRAGRPRLDNPKRLVSLRLDQDILDAFRATGAGWQSRINEVLRAHKP